MRTINFSDTCNNLAAVIDQAVAGADAILITRQDGPNAVLLSQSQYDSIMETLYLLSSPANAAHLAKSIEQHRRGETRERPLARDNE